jgi:single-strand DNA-binding protein
MNHIAIIGNLTSDPETRFTQSGKTIASFSIAYNNVFYQGEEKKEVVSFFNCEAWGKIGENIAKFFHKGDKIAITGNLKQDRWEDQDGKSRSVVKINVTGFDFMTSGKKKSDGQDAPADAQNGEPYSDDEIPF